MPHKQIVILNAFHAITPKRSVNPFWLSWTPPSALKTPQKRMELAMRPGKPTRSAIALTLRIGSNFVKSEFVDLVIISSTARNNPFHAC